MWKRREFLQNHEILLLLLTPGIGISILTRYYRYVKYIKNLKPKNEKFL